MAAGSTKLDNRGIDALLPAENCQVSRNGRCSEDETGYLKSMPLAVLAGVFIALDAMFATTVLAGVDGILPFICKDEVVVAPSRITGSRTVQSAKNVEQGPFTGARRDPAARQIRFRGCRDRRLGAHAPQLRP